MNSVNKLLLFAIGLGVLVSGLLGILIVLDISSLQESREILSKVASLIVIGTGVAIAILLLSRVGKSK